MAAHSLRRFDQSAVSLERLALYSNNILSRETLLIWRLLTTCGKEEGHSPL